MASGSFCLRWDCFQRSFAAEFNALRAAGALVDITLCCDNGGKIGAHQLVLAACSAYFSELIKENKCQHMVFYMRGVQPRLLRSLIEFVYCGSVDVDEHELNNFLRLAKSLQIRGLSSSDTEEKGDDDTAARKSLGKSNILSSEEDSAPSIETPSGNTETSEVACVELTDDNSDPVETLTSVANVSPVAKTCEKLDRDSEESGTLSRDPSIPASLQYCEDISTISVKQEFPDDFVVDSCDASAFNVPTVHETSVSDSLEFGQLESSWTDSMAPLDLLQHQQQQQLQSSSSFNVISSAPQPECMYVCKYCGRRYGSRVSMLHHVKVHSGHTQCRLCQHVCSTVAHLRRHLAKIHSLSADQISSLVPSRRMNSISLLARS